MRSVDLSRQIQKVDRHIASLPIDAVTDYGLVADNATDNSAAMATAVAAAIASKRPIFLRAGTYYFASVIAITDSVKISGDPNGGTKLRFLPAGALAVSAAGLRSTAPANSRVQIRDVEINTTSTAGAGVFISIGFQASGAAKTLLVDCQFTGTWTHAVKGEFGASVTLRQCDLIATQQCALMVDDTRGTQFKMSGGSCLIGGGTQADHTLEHCLYLYGGVDIDIDGVDFAATGPHGYAIHNYGGSGTSTGRGNSTRIRGCRFAPSLVRGILCSNYVATFIEECSFAHDRKLTTTVVAATDLWTATDHRYTTADAIILSSTGNVPAGFVAGTVYYVSSNGLTANAFKLADTAAHALAGTNTVDATDTGSGVISVQLADSAGNESVLGVATRGQAVAIANCDFRGRTTQYAILQSTVSTEPVFIANCNIDVDAAAAVIAYAFGSSEWTLVNCRIRQSSTAGGSGFIVAASGRQSFSRCSFETTSFTSGAYGFVVNPGGATVNKARFQDCRFIGQYGLKRAGDVAHDDEIDLRDCSFECTAANGNLRVDATIVGTVWTATVRGHDNRFPGGEPESNQTNNGVVKGWLQPAGEVGAVLASGAALVLRASESTVHITGVTAIDNITVANGSTRLFHGPFHLIADGAWSTSAAGNIKAKTNAARAVNDVVTLIYDSIAGFWYEV